MRWRNLMPPTSPQPSSRHQTLLYTAISHPLPDAIFSFWRHHRRLGLLPQRVRLKKVAPGSVTLLPSGEVLFRAPARRGHGADENDISFPTAGPTVSGATCLSQAIDQPISSASCRVVDAPTNGEHLPAAHRAPAVSHNAGEIAAAAKAVEPEKLPVAATVVRAATPPTQEPGSANTFTAVPPYAASSDHGWVDEADNDDAPEHDSSSVRGDDPSPETLRPTTPKKAFAKFPHDVAMDPRLSADALAVLAYRGTFVGDFRLHHVSVRKRLGIGKTRFYAILELLGRLGYLTREQVRKNGAFGRAKETVNLDCAPRRYVGYRVHYRSLFEQSIEAKSLGIYLYLAAFAKTFAISLSQVEARFQRCNASAGKHLKVLIDSGLVERQEPRTASGRFKGTTYVARWPSPQPDTVKSDTVEPDAAAPDPANADAYIESKTTNNEKPTDIEEVSARERDDNPDETDADDLVWELMSYDRAGALAPALLTSAGLAGYLDMVRAHGELARQVVADLLLRSAMDGSRPGKIRSWKYFAQALTDAVAAAERALNGFDPAELQSSWRSKPLDPPF